MATVIAKKHLYELLESSPKESNTFVCKILDDEHYIPKKGFAINKSFQNALDIKLNMLKLNRVYEECKTEINDAKFYKSLYKSHNNSNFLI